MSNIISQVEQGLFKYQDRIDSTVAKLLHLETNDVTVSGRSAFLLASVAAVLPFRCDFLKEDKENTGSNNEENSDQCPTYNCGDNGTCYWEYDEVEPYYCDCYDGYEFKYNTCLPLCEDGYEYYGDDCWPIEKKQAPKPKPSASTDTISSPIDDKDTFQSEDTYVSYTPEELCTQLGLNSCLNEKTALMCYLFAGSQPYNYKTIDCEEGWVCQDGYCVENTLPEDPKCSNGKHSACKVTDIVDFGTSEYPPHNVKTECNMPSDDCCDFIFCYSEDYSNCYCEEPTYCYDDYSIYDFACGEDKAIGVQASFELPTHESWLTFDMSVTPPPTASYYKLDGKFGWYTDVEGWLPELTIYFGDDLKKVVSFDSAWESCVFNYIADFGTESIDSSKTTIRIANTGEAENNLDTLFSIAVCNNYKYEKRLAYFAKARLWSCECK